MKLSTNLSEKFLQEKLYQIISDPSKIYNVKSGKRLQILSPGRINVNEGPDFLDVAILLNGLIYVGSAEYHKNSSDWQQHKHDENTDYNNVILHIISNDDIELANKFETLIIPILEISDFESTDSKSKDVLSSIEDLQHFALVRMLRKSSEAQKLLKRGSIEYALTEISREYLERYNSRKRRPSYSSEKLKEILEGIAKSNAIIFLNDLQAGNVISIPDIMQNLVKQKIVDEGAHLRRELILNAVLPIAICLANEESRINLFLWYWSTPALNHYGMLSRRFSELPQNFLWQQQGMLEYIKLHGRQENVASEAISEYAFGEILSFYQSGKSPYSSSIITED